MFQNESDLYLWRSLWELSSMSKLPVLLLSSQHMVWWWFRSLASLWSPSSLWGLHQQPPCPCRDSYGLCPAKQVVLWPRVELSGAAVTQEAGFGPEAHLGLRFWVSPVCEALHMLWAALSIAVDSRREISKKEEQKLQGIWCLSLQSPFCWMLLVPGGHQAHVRRAEKDCFRDEAMAIWCCRRACGMQDAVAAAFGNALRPMLKWKHGEAPT